MEQVVNTSAEDQLQPTRNSKLPLPKIDELKPDGKGNIYWSRFDPIKRLVPVTCPVCGKERHVKPERGNPNFPRLCKSCSQLKGFEDVLHRSGAIIHLRVRHPNKPEKVMFTCQNRGGDRGVHTSFGFYQWIKRDGWHGMCRPCLREQPTHNQITKPEVLKPYKSIIHFEGSDPDNPRNVLPACASS